MLSVLEILKKTTDFFAAKGIDNARLNAELIIGHSLGLKRMQLYLQFERLLTETELEKLRPLVRRRAQREPLQYVTGEVEWGGLRLKTDRRALIPRVETELLLEIIPGAFASAVAGRTGAAAPTPSDTHDAPRATDSISPPDGTDVPVPPGPRAILDLGTGSGALALGLATVFPDARVTALDVSADALALARENAALAGLDERVRFARSDWFAALRDGTVNASGGFDVIVANPPYLSAAEVAESAPEVREFEPRTALASADEGKADLAKIIAGAPEFLREGGLLALETGIAQHPALLALCEAAGFARSESRKDLAGRERFVLAWR
ncbi:protein-(glutamine-N5) methyltransferase, release factor-specific [Termitidicoccus mucosus]|uniref:Release factor glutamine methyltransferase n=2 Tax=Termitidicoccus mucosus TaxID=1184151 RepID=A0A178IE96_9BACT|nr:protein-(glutamine-N5) methyltransferase, release factor-specific [Opitutaceae bacterium TSB47]